MAMPKRTGRVRKSREAKTPKSTIGVVWLAPFEEGVLLPEALDTACSMSSHLAVEVGRSLQGHGGITAPSKGLILVAESVESDQQGWFCLDDVDGLLERFSESPSTLGESGMHLGSASLFPWEELKPSEWVERRRRELTSGLSPARVPEMGQGAQQEPTEQTNRENQLREWLTDPTFREFAKRVIAEFEQRDTEEAGGVPGLDVPGPAIERPALVRFEEYLDRSHAWIFESREAFAKGLIALAGQPFPAGNPKKIIDQINRRCESTFSALREPGGQLVTLRFDEKSSHVELISFINPKSPLKINEFPLFDVVDISSLTDREASIALGRFSGRRAAGRISDEQRAEAGRMAADKMTPAQLKDRAIKGGKAVAASLTPEQRSEKARKAAQAKHAKERARKQSS